MTGRELVYSTLKFRNKTGRAPRSISMPVSPGIAYDEEMLRLRADIDWDIVWPPVTYASPVRTVGDLYTMGEYVDEWNCRFVCIENGLHGEVKEPAVRDEDWRDVSNARIPEELLSFDADAVNRFCASSDKFVLSGYGARPFERLQFVRGSAQAYIDLAYDRPGMREFLKRMHGFNCRMLAKWAKTDVDALMFLDDWGSQKSLLISPSLWVEVFKPLYQDYISIAHVHGKKAFMHTDGYTPDIIPHLVGMELDAINAQIFAIGVSNLAPFKGKITFWGEMDRQRLIPYGTEREIEEAVDLVYNTLWENGGCIAHCGYIPPGRGSNPMNVRRYYARWDALTAKQSGLPE